MNDLLFLQELLKELITRHHTVPAESGDYSVGYKDGYISALIFVQGSLNWGSGSPDLAAALEKAKKGK